MAVKIFGFEFGKKPNDPNLQSPVTRDQEAAITVDTLPYGGVQTYALDLDGIAVTENNAIDRYRDISALPEVDKAIEEIVSDAIIGDQTRAPVSVRLDNLELSEKIKNIISQEFNNVLNVLHFRTKGYDIFRRWYIDGRIYYHIVIDQSNPKLGIQELRYVDSKKIKRVKESISKPGQQPTDEQILNKEYIEYYIYNEKGTDNSRNNVTGVSQISAPMYGEQSAGVKIAKDSIAYCHSGLLDTRNNIPISYLQKALRPANNLRMMEDSLVIYRLARAPERRIFYIDVGNLHKGRAEQYMQQIMTKYKNKLVYDATTGEVKDDRRHLAMTEDYWIPRREGGTGTQIDTLPGGENLGVMEDVEYFKKKLLESLNVPLSRFAQEPSLFNSGTDISRDELRFGRFISRLRSKFSELFVDLLGKQLILKNIMSLEYWNVIKGSVAFDFIEDNYFSEQMQTMILTNRLNLATMVQPFLGQFFSKEYVYKKVLMMTDEEIEDIKKQIEQEIKTGQLPDPATIGPDGQPLPPPPPQF